MNKVFDSAEYDLAERLLREFLGAHPDYVGAAFVCSAKEWAARGETYGKNSLGVLVVDGSPLYDILGGYRVDPVINQLHQSLEGYGLYLEPALAWAYCIYKC